MPALGARQVLDFVRGAWPLALAGGLAAYTWWLVQSAPQPEGPAAASVPATVPDYILQQAVIERLDAQGRRSAVIRGQSMAHVAEGDRLSIQGLDLEAEDVQGQWLQARSPAAVYEGDAGRVLLTDGARVVARAASGPQAHGPLVFEGQALTVELRERRLSAQQSVRLHTPQGSMQGGRMVHDARTGVTDISGRVSGQYAPQAVAP